jgi:hypothetical protein
MGEVGEVFRLGECLDRALSLHITLQKELLSDFGSVVGSDQFRAKPASDIVDIL